MDAYKLKGMTWDDAEKIILDHGYVYYGDLDNPMSPRRGNSYVDNKGNVVNIYYQEGIGIVTTVKISPVARTQTTQTTREPDIRTLLKRREYKPRGAREPRLFFSHTRTNRELAEMRKKERE